MTPVRFRFLLLSFASLLQGVRPAAKSDGVGVVIQWNRASLRSVNDSKVGSPMASRVLAIVNTCLYDAWVAYDEHALGTQLSGALRRPIAERTRANKERAISYAAYRALTDLLPADTESVYKPLMKHLGYDAKDNSTDIETPTGIGNVACAAVLEFRHHDKSNQLGDLAQGPYSDPTHYSPVNPPGSVPIRFPFTKPLNPDRWQPLTYIDSSGSLVLQMFSTAHWGSVTPFALTSGDQLRSLVEPGPATFGTPEYEQQAEELLNLSGSLTDRQKMIAEYWSDSHDSESLPAYWFRFAEFVSARDHHSLDDDVKMFFVLSNAVMDADIAAWDAKRVYDSVRPVTAIAFLFKGKTIRAWGGPSKGTVEMDGSRWTPYQPATSPTPPCPEYVSEMSAESAAAAEILSRFTGSDHFGDSVSLEKGSSKIEPDITPHETVTLRWQTFTEAADEAGMSGRYAGIHFRRSDVAGRALGRAVADSVWAKANSYFSGVSEPTRDGHTPPQ